MELSIVVPIKDEKDNIRKLHERISEIFSGSCQRQSTR